MIEGLTVRHLDELPQAVATEGLRLAMICVPAESAQRVADQLVAAGVSVVAVDLSVQLEHLAYSVHNLQSTIRQPDDVPAAS